MANLVVQRTAESGYRRRGISALRPTHSAGSRVLARDTDSFNETYPVSEGSFKIDMADAISRDGRTGVKGTISFTPDQRAPDSPDIRLIQAIRIIDLRTKKDVDWSKIIDTGRKGEEATRNAIETQADPLLQSTLGGTSTSLPRRSLSADSRMSRRLRPTIATTRRTSRRATTAPSWVPTSSTPRSGISRDPRLQVGTRSRLPLWM
jgi:hypothetical protein